MDSFSNTEWFFAPDSMKLGDDIELAIKQATQECTQFHFFWSRHMCSKLEKKSKYVTIEVEEAFHRLRDLRAKGESHGFIFPYNIGEWEEIESIRDKNPFQNDVHVENPFHPHPARHLYGAYILSFTYGSALYLGATKGPVWGHILAYAAVAILGFFLASVIFKKDAIAQARVCFNIAFLGALDACAWIRLPVEQYHLVSNLVRLDWFAFAALSLCVVLVSAAPFWHEKLWKRLRLRAWVQTPAPAAIALVAYGVLIVWYWLKVKTAPSDFIKPINSTWEPIDLRDAISVTLWLYGALILGSIIVAVSTSIRAKKDGWSLKLIQREWRLKWVQWLSALPPFLYLVFGPWTAGGPLWKGSSYLRYSIVALFIGFLGLCTDKAEKPDSLKAARKRRWERIVRFWIIPAFLVWLSWANWHARPVPEQPKAPFNETSTTNVNPSSIRASQTNPPSVNVEQEDLSPQVSLSPADSKLAAELADTKGLGPKVLDILLLKDNGSNAALEAIRSYFLEPLQTAKCESGILQGGSERVARSASFFRASLPSIEAGEAEQGRMLTNSGWIQSSKDRLKRDFTMRMKGIPFTNFTFSQRRWGSPIPSQISNYGGFGSGEDIALPVLSTNGDARVYLVISTYSNASMNSLLLQKKSVQTWKEASERHAAGQKK